MNGKKGVWGHAIGGMGAITEAMASVARGHGVEIDLDAGAREVIVERDRAVGVILDNGEDRRAPMLPPASLEAALYRGWSPAMRSPRSFLDRIENWRNGSGTFRINVAFNRCPRSRRCPALAIIYRPASSSPRASATWMAPGRTRGRRQRRAGDRGSHSLDLDDTLCPAGEHVASLFCQHVAPE